MEALQHFQSDNKHSQEEEVEDGKEDKDTGGGRFTSDAGRLVGWYM
jgi:hypothetical protein